VPELPTAQNIFNSGDQHTPVIVCPEGFVLVSQLIPFELVRIKDDTPQNNPNSGDQQISNTVLPAE
jgi:hypothetical protein